MNVGGTHTLGVYIVQDAGGGLCVRHADHGGLRMWRPRVHRGRLEEEVGRPAPRCTPGQWGRSTPHPVHLSFPSPVGRREGEGGGQGQAVTLHSGGRGVPRAEAEAKAAAWTLRPARWEPAPSARPL